MLDSLLEIELAYSILKSEGDTGEKDPVDVHYEKLATDMEVRKQIFDRPITESGTFFRFWTKNRTIIN